MKIKIGNKYVTGINNSTKSEPISLILEDKTESVWNIVGLHLLQRKFPDVVFDVEV